MTVIPTKEELIEYVSKKVAEKGYRLEIVYVGPSFAINIQKRKMVFNPYFFLRIVDIMLPILAFQEYTWKDVLEYYLEHEFGHEESHPFIIRANYKPTDFDYGVEIAADHLIDIKLSQRSKKVHHKQIRFILLPSFKSIYEEKKKPIELKFAYCGNVATAILLKYTTLNEVKPYLSKKTIKFVEKWMAILRKVKDVDTLIQALQDVKSLYYEFIGKKK